MDGKFCQEPFRSGTGFLHVVNLLHGLPCSTSLRKQAMPRNVIVEFESANFGSTDKHCDYHVVMHFVNLALSLCIFCPI